MNKFVARTVAAIALAVTAVLVSGASDAPAEPECVVAARWAEENVASLPSELPAFSRLTIAYRKAAYHRLDQNAKVELWRQQFDHYQATETFTAPQLALIEEARATLEMQMAPEGRALRKVFGARAIAVFGKDRAVRLFGELGSHTPTPAEDAASRLAGPTECSCNTVEDFCNTAGPACSRNFDMCTIVTDGCGWLWCEPCNGTCGG